MKKRPSLTQALAFIIYSKNQCDVDNLMELEWSTRTDFKKLD